MDPLNLTAKRADHVISCAKAVERDLGVAPVHELRVACRRLVQSIDMLGSFFERSERKRLRKLTNTLRRIFGDLRDADVLLEFLRQWLSEAPHTLPEVVAASHLITLLATKRRRETQRVRQALKQEQILETLTALQALSDTCRSLKELRRKLMLKDHLTQGDAAPKPNRTSRIDRAIDKTWRATDNLLTMHPLDTTPEGLSQAHDVRIVFKSYRYAVEAYAEKLPSKERKALLKPFKAVQDSLGQIQDASVLLDHIAASRAALPPKRLIKGLNHIDLNVGFDALRTSLLDFIQGHFDAFDEAFANANASLNSHRNTP